MFSKDDIYLLMRTLERSIQGEFRMWGPSDMILYSRHFAPDASVSLSAFCEAARNQSTSNTADGISISQAPVTRKGNPPLLFRPNGKKTMSLFSNLYLPGVQVLHLDAGLFSLRPEVQSFTPYLPPLEAIENVQPHELTDQEFTELPILWGALVRKLSDFLAQQCDLKNQPLSAKEIIEKLIESRFRYDLSLSEIAERLSWSASYTTVRIRQLFGKSFLQLLNERRMKHAKHLLKSNHYLSIVDIARESGFHTIPSFYRVFTNYEGIPPAEFRNREKQSKTQ